jgi:integrase
MNDRTVLALPDLRVYKVTRRSNVEGRRPKVTWALRRYWRDADSGKDRFEQLEMHTTRRGAESAKTEWLANYAARVEEELAAASAPVTFLACARDMWLPHKARLKASTRSHAAWAVDRLAGFAWAAKPLADVTTNDIDEMTDFLLEFGRLPRRAVTDDDSDSKDSAKVEVSQELKPRTVDALRSKASEIFKMAIELGLVGLNPVTRSRRINVPKSGDWECWTEEELATFLLHVEGHHFGPAFRLMAAVGTRRGETLGLRWSDIDWTLSQIRIRQQVLLVDGVPTIVESTKTPAGNREVPIDTATLECLRQHRDAEHQRYDTLGIRVRQRPTLVYTSEAAGLVNPGTFTRAHGRLTAEAGVKSITVHEIRHTAASLMMRHAHSMSDVQAISRILGHSNVQITLDTYGHHFLSDRAAMQSAHGQQMAGKLDDARREALDGPSASEVGDDPIA